MQKRIILGVGISGLVLATLCAVVYLIIRAPKAPKPAEVELGLNLPLPDNPIVFRVEENGAYTTTLGFIDPDGSNFTTREIDMSLTRYSYHVLDQTTWGPDGTFLVTQLINSGSDNYLSVPLVITGNGETRRCKDLRVNGTVWVIDSTHILINKTISAGESYQIVNLNTETCQIEDVIYTSSNVIGDFAISSDGWIAYESFYYEYETDFFGRRHAVDATGYGIIVVDDQQREVFRVDYAHSPNWSRDGKWLTYDFSDYDKGQLEVIKIVNRSGSDTQLITDVGSHPWWSPDGEWLVYSTSYDDIYKINITTKEKVLLYSGGSYPTWR
jgi:hypothetical protein